MEHYLDEITFIGDFLGKKYEKFDKMSNEVGDEVIRKGVVLLKAFLAESDISENRITDRQLRRMEVELAIHQNANRMSKRFEEKKRVKIGHFYENQTVSV